MSRDGRGRGQVFRGGVRRKTWGARQLLVSCSGRESKMGIPVYTNLDAILTP